MPPTDRRPKVNVDDIALVFKETRDKLNQRLNEKGNGIFVSSHECFGILQEEVNEYLDTIQANDKVEQYNELMDVAVAAMFAMASMHSGKMDWL